mgnify:CR=1 FL=1
MSSSKTNKSGNMTIDGAEAKSLKNAGEISPSDVLVGAWNHQVVSLRGISGTLNVRYI